MSSSKWLTPTIMSCVLLCCLASASANADYTDQEMRISFNFMNGYVEAHKELDDGAILKVAKSLKKRLSPDYGKAASTLVYLSELKKCSPKALDYMAYALVGRPNSQPGHYYKERIGDFGAKNRLDKLVEAGLVRASEKCKSFINSWHDRSEQALDGATRDKLYRLFPSNTLARFRRDRQKARIDDDEMLFNAARNDASAKEQLAKLKTEPELIQFYLSYLEENFKKPCKKYVKVMEGVMSRAEYFGSGHTTRSHLFDKPTQSYLDSTFRYDRCKQPIFTHPDDLTRIAKRAAKRSLEPPQVAGQMHINSPRVLWTAAN